MKIIRPEIEFETSRPIFGRLYFLGCLPKLFKVTRKKLNNEDCLIVPKIRLVVIRRE